MYIRGGNRCPYSSHNPIASLIMPALTVNTSATELHWVVVGYNTRQNRNVALGYICDTRAQAYAKCQTLHPEVDIYFVRLGDLN